MLQRLAEFLNLEIDLKAYQGHYSQPEKARDLPSDELISTWRDKIPNQKLAVGLWDAGDLWLETP